MRVLLDTNIIIDAVALRQPFCENAVKILHLFAKKQIECSITASTATDIYYISSSYRKDKALFQELHDLFLDLDIITVTKEDCLEAFDTGMDDYEDSLLSLCAGKWGANYIITRNIKDFTNSRIPAILPGDFLKLPEISRFL
jgi:predicted nucleic acid-binding protein